MRRLARKLLRRPAPVAMYRGYPVDELVDTFRRLTSDSNTTSGDGS